MNVAQAAAKYAELGWTVFPVRPGGKEPAVEHGVKAATRDPMRTALWFDRDSTYNIGIAAGTPSGFFVVDIDPRNGGGDTWAALTKGRPEYQWYPGVQTPNTVCAYTGGGGLHILFKLPEDFEVKNGSIGEGIDIKSTGGYIVAPPSVHPSGELYKWAGIDGEIAEAPQWLLDLLPRKREVVVVDGGLGFDDPDDDRPGAQFNRTMTWAEILEPAGWSVHGVGADGEIQWTRPGKDGGISATTGWDGMDILYVFTSSTEFEAGTGYSKFTAYAILNHGGDFSAAAKEISGTVGVRPMSVFSWGPEAQPAPEQEAVYTWEPALPEDHLVSRYVDWCYQQTDAAREYHEAAGLVLLSLVAWKAVGKLATFPDGLHTNLYVLLTGSSTVSRKSTSQKLALSVARLAYGTAELPSKSTTEAFIGELAEKSGLATIWTPDELGIKLGEIYQRDYLKGVEEMLLTLYDCQTYTYVKVSEKVVIEDPHLSILGAATPESLAMAGPGAMVGGLLPRFAVVLPEGLPEPRAVSAAADVRDQKLALVASLKEIIGWTASHRDISFSDEALEVLNDAESGLHRSGVAVARLATMLYKVSMLIAIGRKSEVVELSDALAAAKVVKRWEEGAKRLQPYLRRKAADLEFESYAENAFRVLKSFGPGKHHRSKVARELKLQKSRVDAIQAALTDWSYIEVEQTQQGTMWKVNA